MTDDKRKNQQEEISKPQQPRKKIPDGFGSPDDRVNKMQRPEPWPSPPADDDKD